MKNNQFNLKLSDAVISRASSLSFWLTVLSAPFLVLFFLYYLDRNEFSKLFRFEGIIVGWILAAMLALVLLFTIFKPMTWFYKITLHRSLGPWFTASFVIAALAVGGLIQAITFGFNLGEDFTVALSLANGVCLVLGSVVYSDRIQKGILKENPEGYWHMRGQERDFVEEF